MTFKANESLDHYVNKKTKGSLYGVISAIFLFIILNFAFYYNSSSTEIYYIEIAGAFIISCAGIYSFTVMEGVKLNKLVREITLVNNDFAFTTYPYRCLFYIIPPQKYTFNKSGLKIQEVVFPFNSLGLINNKTYRVNLERSDVYICYECFPDNLLLELNIKVNS